MADQFKILVINPGSTSTKLAIFHDEDVALGHTIRHTRFELEPFRRIWDQYELRKRLIVEFLEDHRVDLSTLSAVVGRGGLFRPVVGGTYRVNDQMIEDGRAAFGGEHPSNLGAILAYGIGWDLTIPAFIVDPPSVDEFEELARYSGLPELPRRSLFHALNVKATARLAAKDMGKRFDEVNVVVVHMGGGVTVAAMRSGRVVDANNGLCEGPFTPERAGSLPTLDLIEWCRSEERSFDDVKRRLVGEGGLVAYLGVNDASAVERMIAEGTQKARKAYEAMIYQIAQEIGRRAVTLKGQVDAIVLTGGLARSDYIVSRLKEWTAFLAPTLVFPGEDEMKALALGALRVLRGEEDAKEYPETIEAESPDGPDG